MPFVSDSFTDTDGTPLQNHAPESGGDWQKLDASYQGDARGNATIQSNGVMNRSDMYRNSTDPGSADLTIQAVFYSGDGQMTSSSHWGYLLARLPDTATGFASSDCYLGGRSSGQVAERDWCVAKLVSGTFTILDSGGTEGIEVDTTWDVEFSISDSEKKLTADDGTTLKERSTVDNDITRVGRVGLNIGREGARFENFAAESTATPDEFDPANLAVIIDGTTAQLSWDASPLLST